MITVAGIGVTPVKALRLHSPDEIVLERCGVAENRRFYLIDDEGNLVNGRRAGVLSQVAATCDRDATRLSLQFPDAAPIDGDVALAEAVHTDFWGRPVAGRVCTGPWAAALSARAGFPLRLVRSERPGEACDVQRVTLVSRASLERLARHAGSPSMADERRFRMLLVLDGCRPHEEDEWEGRRMQVGDAVIRVGGPVPRCVITTLNPDTGDRDVDTLRAIRDRRGLSDRRTLDFGVYAEVEAPGHVRTGDVVRRLPT